MRRNKFVNPLKEDIVQSIAFNDSANIKDMKAELTQNRIYFPVSSKADQLLPYKTSLAKNFKRTNFNKSVNAFYVEQFKTKSKSKDKKKSSHFKSNHSSLLDCYLKQQNDHLIKYNTIDLRNVPSGAKYNFAGATVYRSKNVKSLNRFDKTTKISPHRKSQLKRASSIKNEQSFDRLKSLKKTVTPHGSKFFLPVSTKKNHSLTKFISSRQNIPSLLSEKQIEQLQYSKYEKAAQNLCEKIIKSQLYSSQDNFLHDSQYFF